MDLLFQPMTQSEAERIAAEWHYDGKYSFYDIDADEEDLEEFLDPTQRENTFTVYRDGELVGFYSFNPQDSFTIDIGLGMHPALTGKGLGIEFLEEGLKFAQSSYHPTRFTLSVATFNERAMKVYEKAGFSKVETFMQDMNGSTYEFVKMEKRLGE